MTVIRISVWTQVVVVDFKLRADTVMVLDRELLVDGQVVMYKEVVAVAVVQARPRVPLGQRLFPRWTTTGRQEAMVMISAVWATQILKSWLLAVM